MKIFPTFYCALLSIFFSFSPVTSMFFAQKIHASTILVPSGGICLSPHPTGPSPRHYRCLWGVPGFPENFRVSASGQFTVSQLNYVIDVARAQTHDPSMPIYMVDLRHELHGFLENGEPIYVWGEDFWRNLNRFLTETYEQAYFENLNTLEEVPYFPHIEKKDGVRYNKGAPEALSPREHPLTTEGPLCKNAGVIYVRLPIIDHDRPDPVTVEAILNFFQSLPDNAWIHVHCHAGKGRTSTFLILYHLFKKREKNLNAVIQLHMKHGSIDTLKNHKGTKEKPFQRRSQFVRKFFAFSKDWPWKKWSEKKWSE